MYRKLPVFTLLLLTAACLRAQVILNEIHYHPLEMEAFAADGAPLLDLSDDVHEFIEIRNTGAAAVDLSGWKLSDGVTFTFPNGTLIAAGGYRVIAKNAGRIQTVYGISGVLAPYTGKLSNSGEGIRLKNTSGTIVDGVNYSATFPWAVSADSLGANEDFLGISRAPYQYKGRSLERVSATATSNDAANWLASPLVSGPTPGVANTVSRATPKPVVVAFNVYQNVDESPIVRAGNSVRVNATFSSATSLSSVQLEFFVDNVNVLNPATETRSTIAMTDIGGGQFVLNTAIPGTTARSIVRFRIKANRGDGIEIVSPRLDDPQLVPVSAGVKEGWHSYFVEPVRADNGRPDYDFFISDSGVTILSSNIDETPRRITSLATPGYPRDDPFFGYHSSNPTAFPQYNPANYPAAGMDKWNGTVPAVFVKDGVVHDIMSRFHGSRYRRSADANSWKFNFPSSKLLDGEKQRILVTEKGSETVLGFALFHAAGLPAGYAQFVDFYRNGDTNGTQRCEISDNDEETIKRIQDGEEARNPQNPPAFIGEGIIYKSKGLDGDEGPYGWANGQKMPARFIWTQLDRYIWSFPIQNSDWRGHLPLRDMLNGMWAARGDESRVTYPNTYNGDARSFVSQDALRTFMDANWDRDKILGYMALRNWMAPWDDKFHNHHVYMQGDGKWTMLPWDFDAEMNGGATGDAGFNNSIFAGKKDDGDGSYSNNFRGPNWYKDSVLRAYDDSTGPNTSNAFRQKMFILNNTLLKPANVAAVAAASGTAVPDTTWLNSRFNSVNSQLGLGIWYAPVKPGNSAPSNNASVLPGATLVTTAYSHTNPSPKPHNSTRWEIRSSQGTYAAPIYNVVSTSDLTSLPIPFELLVFGKTYFWRATHEDSDGHPSDASNESSFLFGLPSSTVSLLPISTSSIWKYNQTATFDYPNPAPAPNSSTWWASTTYNDTSWNSGAPLLAVSTNSNLPPNVRTTLTHGRRTYYFRRSFDFPGSPNGATVRATRWIDDGCVVFINGVEVPELRKNMAGGTPAYTTLATFTVGVATEEGAIAVPSSYFVQGPNTIAVEVHQANTNSSDIVFALGLEADLSQSSGEVVINEVMSDNRAAVENGGVNPDYVELHNPTGTTVDISGWNLTDDILVPGKYTFPANTSIAANGYLIVWCDFDFSAPGLHAGFKISASGQSVALISGSAVKDFITFGPQAEDLPIGRVGAGVGPWTLVNASPNMSNTGKAFGSATNLKVNEWMANPSSGEDWIELHNPDANPVAIGDLYLSDTPSSPLITRVPPLSFIAGKGFTRFEADGDASGANHCNFKLSASGETIVLTAANGLTTINSVSFGAQSSNVSSGHLPDGAAAIVAFPSTPTPAASNYLPASIVINEALTASTLPREDAIELLNPTASNVNIGGWWLSDDERNPRKYQIPPGTILAAGGFKVFYENQFNPAPGTAGSFALSSFGDDIVLSAIDGGGALNGFRTRVKFGAAADGVAFGSVLTGSPAGSQPTEFWPLTAHTFGSDSPADLAGFRTGNGLPNAAPRTAPVTINEVMYRPVDLPGAMDNARDEFIELHNTTTATVPLAGWKLKGDSDFTFPLTTEILPGDYALLVSFDPVTDNSSLDIFRTTYGLTSATRVFGPYSPKLSNSRQELELARPGIPVGAAQPFIMVDRVSYSDRSPWPTAPDGTGQSLQRLSRTFIGNDVTNWSGANPTPGAVNAGQTLIADSDGDGIPDAWETANALDRFSSADASLDSDGDGRSNLLEYVAGTDPGNAASFLDASVAIASGGGYKIDFIARANRSYTIQRSLDLAEGSWQKVTDISAPATDTPVSHIDNPHSDQFRRFYRIVTPMAR